MHVRWMGFAVSKFATHEFLQQFESNDFNSLFGQMVAEKMPELPDGVDPHDAEVIRVTDCIMRAVGPDSGVSMQRRAKEMVGKLLPLLAEAQAILAGKEATLAELRAGVRERTAAAESQAGVVAGLKHEISLLDIEIEEFWVADVAESRRKYQKAIKPLCSVGKRKWHEMHTLPDRLVYLALCPNGKTKTLSSPFFPLNDNMLTINRDIKCCANLLFWGMEIWG